MLSRHSAELNIQGSMIGRGPWPSDKDTMSIPDECVKGAEEVDILTRGPSTQQASYVLVHKSSDSTQLATPLEDGIQAAAHRGADLAWAALKSLPLIHYQATPHQPSRYTLHHTHTDANIMYKNTCPMTSAQHGRRDLSRRQEPGAIGYDDPALGACAGTIRFTSLRARYRPGSTC
jgi:hypothetical protein